MDARYQHITRNAKVLTLQARTVSFVGVISHLRWCGRKVLRRDGSKFQDAAFRAFNINVTLVPFGRTDSLSALWQLLVTGLANHVSSPISKVCCTQKYVNRPEMLLSTVFWCDLLQGEVLYCFFLCHRCTTSNLLLYLMCITYTKE